VRLDDVSALRSYERDAALLDTLFGSAPIGLAFLDEELRYVRVNDALAAMHGAAVEDHLGHTVLEVVPGMDADLVACMRRVLATGEPVKDLEFAGHTPPEPLVERRWVYALYPVRRRPDGEILGVGVTVADVTDRVRAERRTAFLARAAQVLAESLDLEDTLARVAEITVPDRADLCIVDLLDDQGRVRRVAAVHADREKQAIVAALDERWPVAVGPGGGLGEVLRTGEPKLIRDVDDTVLREAGDDGEQRALLGRLGVTSGLSAPLKAHGRVLGAISFVMSGSGRRLSDDDLMLAINLADRAASAIDNARVYREREHIAETLQRSLLPARLPVVPGYEVAGRYQAAGRAWEVGGDFYDVFATADGRWSVVVGDVCGKGPEAAALTALARHTLRAATLVESAPSRVLGMLNDAVVRDRTDHRFLTVAVVRIDGARIDLALAGQSPAVLVRADGTTSPIGAPGRLVGIAQAIETAEQGVELAPGDALVLFTDGVPDAAAPVRILEHDEIAEVAVTARAGGAEAIADAILDHALDAAAGRPRDDIALVVLRRTG
jgi:PAS domain S-box-containing protein